MRLLLLDPLTGNPTQAPYPTAASVTGITRVRVLSCVRGARSVDMRRRNADLGQPMETHGKWSVGSVVLKDTLKTNVQSLGMDRTIRLEAGCIKWWRMRSKIRP
uniref:Uncharacterized protein n=1 Tax=Tanacetum cinerariifolium TaxID=118510 RepID=A0A699S409_TANCI|nr:hypothetical protein [Tanacetum cinerariifolium]